MKKFILILLIFTPCISFAVVDFGFNAFSAIYNFKNNEAFTSSTYRHEDKNKTKWDVGGGGFYLNATLSYFDWVHMGLYFGRASYSEEIDSFNSYSQPTYQVSQTDYGIEAKLFPFREILFVRLGVLMSSSSHSLLTAQGENIPLFDFSGRGYQAGFGVQFDMEGGCFDYDCGFGIENLVRKAWATNINAKSTEIGYDENATNKPNYRQVMIALNAYFTY